MERLAKDDHRRLGRLLRAAVRQTFNDHPDYLSAADWKRLDSIGNSIAKRAIGAIRSEFLRLRSERGTGARD